MIALTVIALAIATVVSILPPSRPAEFSFLYQFHPHEMTEVQELTQQGEFRVEYTLVFSKADAPAVLAAMKMRLDTKNGWTIYEVVAGQRVDFDRGQAWSEYMSAKVYPTLIWPDGYRLQPVEPGGCIVHFMPESDGPLERLRAWYSNHKTR